MPTTSPIRWLKSHKPLAGAYPHIAVALGAAGTLLLIAQAWLLAKVVDAAIFGGAGLPEVRPWLLTLLVLYLARAVLAWLAERAAFRGAGRVKVALRDRLFRHIQARGPAYLSGERSGALVETLVKGIEDLEPYYARFLPAMTLTILVPLAILVAVVPRDWLSGLVLMLTAPLIPAFMILIGKGAEALNQRQWRQLARMSGRFLDVIQGLATLKTFNASKREAETIAQVSEDYRHSTMQVLRVAFLSSAVLEFISSLSIAVVAVFIGFRLYQLDLPIPDALGVPQIGFFTGFFVLLLAPEFFLPLRNLGAQYHGRMDAIAGAQRLMEVLDTPLPPGARGIATLPHESSLQLQLQDVHFAYEPGREALRGLDLILPAGQRAALVGASGAGKTTLVNLLLGFLQPDAGRILVNGMDLTNLDPADWRRHLAWVPQNPRLFRGTLLDNIRLGAPGADMASVEAAARQARAAAFIEDLPCGYQTQVGEGGAGLSGGQIQRIALARAFLRNAPLVILDEPTASLDPASEVLVQEGIDELAQGRTLLIVAHRLKTVRTADHILVMEAGRIVQSGDHDGLIAAAGPYRDMVSAYGAST
jgi:ATP-binding cassette subfamily C protein CydD